MDTNKLIQDWMKQVVDAINRLTFTLKTVQENQRVIVKRLNSLTKKVDCMEYTLTWED